MRDEEGDSRRKKGKRGTNVPLSELGFKAKLYSGIETEYTRRRVKYKAARYGVENSKECFMARLTLTLQAQSLSQEDIEALPSFRGIKKAEWEKVRAVTYHSRQQLLCAICLEKDFRAPQMTHCGHVFCWPCIYMHHFRSLKATNCPVCNELYSLEALVTCLPLHGRAFPEFDQNRIKLALKCHAPSNGRVYNPLDYKEDMRFSRVVKASTPKITAIFEEERSQLEDFLKECDAETKEWVAKVISLAYDKIERTTHAAKHQYRLQRGEWRSQGYILGSLEDKQSAVTFYQQHSGRLIFLHPLCDRFLRTGPQLASELQGEIIEWQQVEYNLQMARRYKQLHHLVLNQEIDLVILDMRPLLPPAQFAQFEEELALCRTRKQEQREREQREAGRLQAKYEQEKEYLQKLKKMEESEFYDIRVPTTINPNQLNDNAYFPSLIQTKSQPHPSPPPPPITTQKQQKPSAPILREGDFPGLVLQPKIEITANGYVEEPPQLLVSKSEQPKMTTVKTESDFPHLGAACQGQQGVKLQKKGSRRKKEKFVNVTEQFFQRREEDD